jgi:hypothetical protein
MKTMKAIRTLDSSLFLSFDKEHDKIFESEHFLVHGEIGATILPGVVALGTGIFERETFAYALMQARGLIPVDTVIDSPWGKYKVFMDHGSHEVEPVWLPAPVSK